MPIFNIIHGFVLLLHFEELLSALSEKRFCGERALTPPPALATPDSSFQRVLLMHWYMNALCEAHTL